jgi:hypothetical protein
MKLIIPTELSDITLGQLQSLTRLEATQLTDLERQKQTIELLANVDRATIDKIKLNDLNSLYEKLAGLSKSSESLHLHFTIDNIKYGFIPNLSEISTGEFADLDTLCQELNDNLHLIMAILYRPIDKEANGKYSIEAYDADLEERGRIFKKKLNANVVNSAILFFWSIGNDYLNDLLTSSQVEQETKSNNPSVKSGAGTVS